MKPQRPTGFKPQPKSRISRRLARDANPDARIRFRLLGHEAPEARWGRAADLGPGGTCLICDSENAVGDHLALEIHVAGHAPMPALARVLRCEKSTDGFRCGLEFLWLEQTDQDCLTGLATSDDTPPPPPRF